VNSVKRAATLPAPEDVDRQPWARPYAPLAETPELIVEKLRSPGAIVELKGKWYVIEAGAKRVLSIQQSDRQMNEEIAGLEEPTGLATDGESIFVADKSTGKIWQKNPANEPSVIVLGENSPTNITAKNNNVCWSTPSTVRCLKLGESFANELASGLDGVNSVALSATHLFFVEAGDKTKTNAKVGRIDLASGERNTLIGKDVFDVYFKVTDLVIDERNNKVYFPVVLRDWPYISLISSLPLTGGSLKIYNYSPPNASRLSLGGDYLYWSTSRTVSRLKINAPYPFENPAPWTATGGLIADSKGVTWTDPVGGRVYRVTFE
jgi:hypothetical protein